MSSEVKTQVVWLPDGFGGGGHAEVCRASDYTSLEAELTELRHQHDKLAGLLREAAGELRTDRHHGLRPKIYAALSEIKP